MTFVIVLFLIALLVFYGVPMLLRWLLPWLVRRRMQRMADQMRRQQEEAFRRSRQNGPTGDPFADFFASMYGGFQPEEKGKKFDADEGEYVNFEDIKCEPEDTGAPVEFTTEEQVEDVEWVDIEEDGSKR